MNSFGHLIFRNAILNEKKNGDNCFQWPSSNPEVKKLEKQEEDLLQKFHSNPGRWFLLPSRSSFHIIVRIFFSRRYLVGWANALKQIFFILNNGLLITVMVLLLSTAISECTNVRTGKKYFSIITILKYSYNKHNRTEPNPT